MTTFNDRAQGALLAPPAAVGASDFGHGNADVDFKRSVIDTKPRPTLLRPRYLTYIMRREALRLWSIISRTKGRSIITVFDPSLIAFNGHHMEFARMIKEECSERFAVRFYANFRADTRITLSLPAQPICHEGIYPPPGKFDDIYRNMTASTISSLKGIDKRDIGPDAILMMHTVTLYQLSGLAQWFSALPRSGCPKLLLQFQFPLEFLLAEDPATHKRAIGLAREATGTLMATGRTRLAANSMLLANSISKQLDQPCAVLPLPTRWPDLNRSMPPEPGLVFGFFGGLRSEKGASIIAQTIPKFAARYPDTRFLVHVPKAESNAAAIRALEAVPTVELIFGNFVRKDDYFRQFMRPSCILLPYDPIVYADRTSSILIEALGLDRLIITTKDSWLHAEAQRCGGTVFAMTSFTPDAFFESLTAARDYLYTHAIKPKVNRDVVREHSPSAFCAAFIELVNLEKVVVQRA